MFKIERKYKIIYKKLCGYLQISRFSHSPYNDITDKG